MTNSEQRTPTAQSDPLPQDHLRVVAKWLKIFSEAFRVELSAEQIKIYLAALRDLPVEAIDMACTEALKTLKFFPKVAEIRELATVQQTAQLADRVTLEAESDWETIKRHVGRWGLTVWPSDPKLELGGPAEYAFRQIGWRQGLMDVLNDAPKLHWAHQEFVKAYRYHRDTDGLKALPRTEAQRLLDSVSERETRQLTEGRKQ